MGEVLVLSARPEEAIDAFTHAIACGPAWGAAHHGLGRARLHLGDATNALPPLREAVRLLPEDPLVHHNLAVALEGVGRRAEGIPHLRKAFRLAPGARNNTWDGYRDVLKAEGLLGEVLDSARMRVAALPKDVDALIDLGDAEADLWNFVDATPAFRRAIALDDANPRAWERMGESLRHEGGFEQAIEAFRTGQNCAGRDGARSVAWEDRIRVCEDLMMKVGRLASIRSGEEAPARLEALVELAWIASVTGDPSMVLRLCQEGAEAAEEGSEGLRVQVGWLHAAACVEIAQGPAAGGDLRKTSALRAEALRWFRARLDEDRVPSGDPVPRETRVRWLRYLHDPRLESVRGSDSSAALPEAERREWRILWEDARRFVAQP